MNERILELAEQANIEADVVYAKKETGHSHTQIRDKIFAELIVRECIAFCELAEKECKNTFVACVETCDVGASLVAKGGQVQAEKLANIIKEHFGVE